MRSCALADGSNTKYKTGSDDVPYMPWLLPRLLPRFPWRSSAVPEFIQLLFISQTVHRLREAAMEIGLHLLFQSEIPHGFGFEHCSVVANLT